MVKINFRVEGDHYIGFGHIMRCMALAEILRSKFKCIFYVSHLTTYLREQINAINVSIKVIPQFNNILREAEYFSQCIDDDDIIVIDGYGFDVNYQRVLRQKGVKLVFIDDFAEKHQVADVVINHAGNINSAAYSKESYTKLYLGPEYALLRHVFLAAVSERREMSNIKNAFICFGGTNNYELTISAIHACRKTGRFDQLHVVVNDSKNSMLHEFKECPDIIFYQELLPTQMVNVMKQCQIGITSASTLAYEASCIGMGLISIVYTANQKKIGDFLKEAECAIVLTDKEQFFNKLLDFINELQPERIHSQIQRQKSVFSNSKHRITAIFNNLLKSSIE